MELARVTRSLERDAAPARRGPEQEAKHGVSTGRIGSTSKLALAPPKRVGDLKIAG